jgi:hypothetical protein
MGSQYFNRKRPMFGADDWIKPDTKIQAQKSHSILVEWLLN